MPTPTTSILPPHTPTNMPTTNRPQNKGASLNDDASRLDGPMKVTGKAKYGRDMYFANGVYVAFVRCPYGAADLESSDIEAAKKVAGVLEVDLSGKEGKYHGQNVGHIVAETPLTMKRGLRALAPVWKRKPCKTRIEDSMDPKAKIEPDDATVQAIAKADHTLEATYSTPVHIHACMETHGGSMDWKDDGAILYASTQGTSSARDGLEKITGLEGAKLEVVCEYIGGGFGSKLNGAGKEGTLAARIAAKYKRPAYCFINRAEDQTDTGNRPSLRASVKIGFTKTGEIVGGLIKTWGGAGVGGRGGGVRLPSGRYKFSGIKTAHEDTMSNGGSPRPFRAPGCPTAAFVEELMLDEIAAIAGVDPLEYKMRLETDNDRRDMMKWGAEMFGWKNRPATGSQKGVMRRGMGIGGGTWGSGGPGDSAECVINRDGTVEARTGSQDIGTGQRTSMGVCAALKLGIPLEFVTVRIGRSTLPPGPGSGGSGTTANTAPAMMDAALAAREKLLTLVANQAGGDPGEYTIADGEIRKGDKAVLSWKDACAKIGDSIVGRPAGRAKSGTGGGHSSGIQFAEVEVDTETGIIRCKRILAYQSCGQAVVRKAAESQIIGGVIQGVSSALFEQRVLDRNVGTMLNANLEWYKIAGPADMPHIEPVLWTRGQKGIKALGEPPHIPTMGAIACAVFNAIGKPVRDLPMTPDKVLAAMEGGVS